MLGAVVQAGCRPRAQTAAGAVVADPDYASQRPPRGGHGDALCVWRRLRLLRARSGCAAAGWWKPQISKMNKDAQMRATINQKLIETGERERLKELLRAKLIECGWKDQLKAHCKELLFDFSEIYRDVLFQPDRKINVIKEKGLEHVTVDDLVAEITPKGRALVPDSVKKELLQRIRTFLAQHASL